MLKDKSKTDVKKDEKDVEVAVENASTPVLEAANKKTPATEATSSWGLFGDDDSESDVDGNVDS